MNLQYKIIRSNRKTVSIEIRRNAEVLVRAPHWCTDRQIDAFVEEKRAWIEKKLHMLEEDQRREQDLLTAEDLRHLKQEAKDDLAKRVEHFAPLVGVDYGSIRVKAQKSRWGSCSAKGNLNFNCLLMLMPQEVRDYVVVHELCHRLEMNHSPRFWAQVERVLPNYRPCRQYLKRFGSDVITRLPQ